MPRISRRRFVQQLTGATALLGARARRAETMSRTDDHPAVLTTSELQVVIGDNRAGAGDHASHQQRYNGIWSLTSIHQPHNVFVPSYAGLNLEHFMDDLFMTEEGGDIFEPRNLPLRLERRSDTAVSLSHDPSPLTGVASQTLFQVQEPHAIDFSFHATLHRAPRAGRWLGVFWASYIEAPDSPALHFKDSRGLWACLAADVHGRAGGNTVCHESVVSPEIGDPNRIYNDHSLAHSHSRRRFQVPLMYGRPGDGRMLLLYLFDQRAPVRLTMSPSGGGVNRERSTYNPAWDFQYILPEATAGREIRLRARIVYKPYQGRDEIEALYREWQQGLRGN